MTKDFKREEQSTETTPRPLCAHGPVGLLEVHTDKASPAHMSFQLETVSPHSLILSCFLRQILRAPRQEPSPGPLQMPRARGAAWPLAALSASPPQPPHMSSGRRTLVLVSNQGLFTEPPGCVSRRGHADEYPVFAL